MKLRDRPIVINAPRELCFEVVTADSTPCGASAAHSPIAANDRAPQATAAAAITKITCA